MRVHLGIFVSISATIFATIGLGCAEDEALAPEPGEELAGGETTVFDQGTHAFSLAARNLADEHETGFFVGNSFFNKNWVTAPASTTARDGLGPTFNARSCSGCHFHDGRGRPPLTVDEPMLSMLLRLSVPGEDEHGGPKPEPNYGGQLQPFAIADVPPEGQVAIEWSERAGEYDDGQPYSLREPSYEISELAFGELAQDVMISPRVAPQMIGLGLLEAIPEATILGFADPDDDDGDGISGRPNYAWDPSAGELALGRFGWKANQVGLRQQDAGAFLGDIGITSSLHTAENCPPPQAACAAAPNGSEDGAPELDDELLEHVTTYTRLLAVPARREVDDPEVLAGRELFRELGCDGCHVPRIETGELAGFPELSDQVIWPYTDLLVHDMGSGLADGRPDFEADGSEWRTPPLWGIGLFEVVNDHALYLHDGRARGLAEAILWHGGEAQAARDGFAALTADERDALLRFLGSL
jgi:CxxC motif-containing protein (DUF1111 family)